MKNSFYIFDFDSTFIQTESLEELFAHVLEKDPDKAQKLTKIQEITSLGMEGKLNFGESLSWRMKLLKAGREDVKKVGQKLKKQVSPSIKRNKAFFKKMLSIFILSPAVLKK